jgi:hypothetical protein
MARGGKRDGAGRPKGAVNKATADIREAAQEYTTEALGVLAKVMRASESDAAKVAAANSILAYGHGKPRQALEIDATIQERDVADAPLTDDEWQSQHVK